MFSALLVAACLTFQGETTAPAAPDTARYGILDNQVRSL